jgi:hypothetical protein
MHWQQPKEMAPFSLSLSFYPFHLFSNQILAFTLFFILVGAPHPLPLLLSLTSFYTTHSLTTPFARLPPPAPPIANPTLLVDGAVTMCHPINPDYLFASLLLVKSLKS